MALWIMLHHLCMNSVCQRKLVFSNLEYSNGQYYCDRIILFKSPFKVTETIPSEYHRKIKNTFSYCRTGALNNQMHEYFNNIIEN